MEIKDILDRVKNCQVAIDRISHCIFLDEGKLKHFGTNNIIVLSITDKNGRKSEYPASEPDARMVLRRNIDTNRERLSDAIEQRNRLIEELVEAL